MDTSETYIKMCEKAMEIQELWKPDAWDYCYCNITSEYSAKRRDPGKTVVVLSGYETEVGYYGHEAPDLACPYMDYETSVKSFKENHIWLPRQDQLQEMVDWKLDDVLFKFEAFAAFVHPRRTSVFTTFEQLWLGFVMKEKHNKVWDSAKKDWI